MEPNTELSKKLRGEEMRNLSLTSIDGLETEAFMARVKHTIDYKSRGCKGNTRGNFIHEAFITFEQLLTKLPPNIGLDIEISQSLSLSSPPPPT
jgi:hypothetical protein